MMRTPPDAWVEAAFAALAEGGPEAVRVEALAVSLGVSKGGFYWHFRNRQDLLERVLDAWERLMVDAVIWSVDSTTGDARGRLKELFELALGFGASGRGVRAELAVREWARRDASVAKRVRSVDERRMAYMRTLFRSISVDDEEAEARSLVAFTLFVGQALVDVGHPGTSREAVLRRALALLVANDAAR